MVKPIYLLDKPYDVIEHPLPGDSLDEKLDTLKKGRTVVATMALSLYKLEDKLNSSLIKATGLKVVGNSVRGVKTPKHITDTNMKMLLHAYAKRASKYSKHKIYKGILEQYKDIQTDTNLSNTTLREYIDYMEILIYLFGLPEQFHKIATVKLEADGTYTVTTTDASDFVTREELEQDICSKDSEIERLRKELEELKARADKVEEEKKQVEEDRDKYKNLSQAKLYGDDEEGDELTVKIETTYSSNYQIGFGGNSPKEKLPIHPKLVAEIPLFYKELTDIIKLTKPELTEYVANTLPEGGSLKVNANYKYGDVEVRVEQIVEHQNKVQRKPLSLDFDRK